MAVYEKVFSSLILIFFSLILISFVVELYPIAVLSFAFPVLWGFWFFWIPLFPGRKIWTVWIVWGIINFQILLMFLSIQHSIGNAVDSHGAEIIWLFSYGPTIIPSGLLLTFINIPSGISTYLNSLFGVVGGNWLSITSIAFLQSYVYYVSVRMLYKRFG